MSHKEGYYTPEISEIICGYECEKYSGYSSEKDYKVNTPTEKPEYWEPFILTEDEFVAWDREGWSGMTEFSDELEKGNIRTKYLTKEDIEKEGWRNHNPDNNQIFRKGEHILILGPYNDTKIEIRHYGSPSWTQTSFFLGFCPSVNEFRTICKLLGI